jgi:ABC transporter transmembrane region
MPAIAEAAVARHGHVVSPFDNGQPDNGVNPRIDASRSAVTLKSLFAAHRGRMVLTYALFNVENVLKLLQPLVLGWAINDLLAGRYAGLFLFVAQHLLHMVISGARQMYDTRVYNDIYTGLATELITGQRSNNEQVSRVAARSAMSRQYVEFFEQHVPMVIRSGYAVVGALLMLGWYDWTLIPLCVGLLVPAVLLNAAYGRKTLRLNRLLHDDLENEVDIIERSDEGEVRRHFDSVGLWRVKLSDAEASNFCLMELFVLGVMAAALVQFCTNSTAEAGDIFAVFRYVIMFIVGLDSVPKLVSQFSRLHDIGGRVGRVAK